MEKNKIFMSRSKHKGPYVDNKLFNINMKNEIKTSSRASEIIPKFIGKTFQVHNGKTFSNVQIIKEMVGHKLGEFSPTRQKFAFKKKKKR
jgi:small subunit ribosomal protein S19